MLYEVLIHIRNLFPREHYEGTWEIKDGSLELPIADGQYFLIEGSVFNDGVHKYPNSSLSSETFSGTITALAIPQAVVDLSEEIEDYLAKNPATPFMSESFDGYSYSKASSKSGGVATWQSIFKEKLDSWRKL